MTTTLKRRLSIDAWAFTLVGSYALRGTCIRRQAGALGLDEHNRIVGLGMNGVPRGIQHCIDKPCVGATDPAGNTDNCMAIHAEINMIINSHDPAAIRKVYVSTTPCKGCALVLANLPKLSSVKALSKYADDRGIEILQAAGIEVTIG